MERKRRFQTRQQYADQKSKQTKFQKADKRLNYLIAIVAVLIVATLIFIITQDPSPENEAEQQESPEEVAIDVQEEDAGQETEDNEPETNVQEEVEEDVDSLDETEQPTSGSGDIVSSSSDPAVKEVITNPNWPAYPTAQTGEHVSTYEKGHIDYEEKLKAIFSVIDLQQENSIVLRVNNNGSAQNAIAVVTSMDKEQKYRVSIEWIDNEGWKPVQVEVLSTLVGMR